MNDAGQPIQLKLAMNTGFTLDAIAKWAETGLMPKTIITSVCLGCLGEVTEAGCIQMPRIVGALKDWDLPEVK